MSSSDKRSGAAGSSCGTEQQRALVLRFESHERTGMCTRDGTIKSLEEVSKSCELANWTSQVGHVHLSSAALTLINNHQPLWRLAFAGSRLAAVAVCSSSSTSSSGVCDWQSGHDAESSRFVAPRTDTVESKHCEFVRTRGADRLFTLRSAASLRAAMSVCPFMHCGCVADGDQLIT